MNNSGCVRFFCMLDFSLDYRFAPIPNAKLGHIHASMTATLALRICFYFLVTTYAEPL